MKTEEILEEVKEKGFITEKEINLLKRRKNDGKPVDESIFWENQIKVTNEQSQKGFKFLMDQWKTEKGNERKNNPFGFREQKTLETFEYFTFNGFYNTGDVHFSHYEPIYIVYGKNGAFTYYVAGQINIIN